MHVTRHTSRRVTNRGSVSGGVQDAFCIEGTDSKKKLASHLAQGIVSIYYGTT